MSETEIRDTVFGRLDTQRRVTPLPETYLEAEGELSPSGYRRVPHLALVPLLEGGTLSTAESFCVRQRAALREHSPLQAPTHPKRYSGTAAGAAEQAARARRARRREHGSCCLALFLSPMHTRAGRLQEGRAAKRCRLAAAESTAPKTATNRTRRALLSFLQQLN